MLLLYLKQLRIKNIKCFDDVIIDFTDDKDHIRKWTVFLGNNGVGKSILLQIATLVFLGENVSRVISSAKHWVRKGADYGVIEATINVNPILEYGIEKEREFNLKYLITSENKILIDGEEYIGPKIVFDKKYDNNKEFQLLIDRFGDRFRPICAYGPFRHTPKREQDREMNMKFNDVRQDHIATMFNDSAVISDLENWIRVLEYRNLKNRKDTDKIIFESAMHALEEVLPGVKVHEITDREILFETGTGIVPLSELSDGFRSTISWTGNLIQILLSNFSSGDPLKEGSMVVLVDEIEIHLHPEGQRNIVIYLRRLFPNVQFITSSHSPFVPQALEDGESFVVRTSKEKGPNRVEPVPYSVKGWRADQILTDIFDLETARDVDTEEELKKLNELAANKYKYESNEYDEKVHEITMKLNQRIPPSDQVVKFLEYENKLKDLISKLEKNQKK